jgi:hypothetical protein
MKNRTSLLTAAVIASTSGNLVALTFEGKLEASLRLDQAGAPNIAECTRIFNDHSPTPVQSTGQAQVAAATLAPGSYAFRLTLHSQQRGLNGPVVSGWYYLRSGVDIKLHGAPASSAYQEALGQHTGIGPWLHGTQTLRRMIALRPGFTDPCPPSNFDPLCLPGPPPAISTALFPIQSPGTFPPYAAGVFGNGPDGMLPYRREIRHVDPATGNGPFWAYESNYYRDYHWVTYGTPIVQDLWYEHFGVAEVKGAL